MNSTLLPLTTPEEELAYSLGYGVGMGLFICLIALIFILLIFLAVGYIFQALAIKGMYNKLGLRNGWLAFIPYANIFALGKVAEQYVHPYGKKNMKYSIVLVVLTAISGVLSIFSNLLSSFSNVVSEIMPEGPALIVSVFILFLSFIPLAFSIFYCVIFYKALWNIYAIFADGKATLYLILSIFLPVQPFLLFAIRNNEPVNVLNYNAVPVVIDTPYVVETDE